MLPDDLKDEQKLYLQGFLSGTDLALTTRGRATFASTLPTSRAGPALAAPAPPSGPEAGQIEAQDRAIAAGQKLTPQEAAKRKKHPLDMWDDLIEHADAGRFPKGNDVLAFKYHGLFHVAPAQDAYMCRLRLPAGIITSHQLRGVARIADDWGGGSLDITTRANLQIREIPARRGPDVILGLQDLGILPRGSGADNIRNVTATPTAGFDPQELIDTAPLARAMQYQITHHREFYGLPRKFNIAFDGGGTVAALEDTNDIGFTAVRVGAGKSVPAGVYFRLMIGGISGHRDFALDEGVILEPRQCVPVASAIVRLFIEHGDRTDRKKARLKYVLDRWGHEKFVNEIERKLTFPLHRLPLADCEPRPPVNRTGHVGVHPQKTAGRSYVGVLAAVGRFTTDQARGLAAIADQYGSGSIRLTVWQNLLIPDIADADIPAVLEAVEALGLDPRGGLVRAGLVACTGKAGCRFAAADTKAHAALVADHLDATLKVDQPINIHLTGCPNSCAQHYIGDIGLLGAGVEVGDDLVEGYHVFVGGGHGADQGIGRELFRSVAATDVPGLIERMLTAYQERRSGPDETFDAFVRRRATDQLQAIFAAGETPTPAITNGSEA